VPTVPDADDESPYWICQVEPELFLNVLDFEELKMVWPLPWDWVLLGSSVDQHQRSEDPESKS
jgi:hypothetical protein